MNKKKPLEPMKNIAVYVDRRTSQRVFVTQVEVLETGTRIHYQFKDNTLVRQLGRKAFKDKYYFVAGVNI